MIRWIPLLLLMVILVAPGCCRTPQQPLPAGSIPLTNGYGTPVQPAPQVTSPSAAPVVKKTTPTRKRTVVRKATPAKPVAKKTATKRHTVRRSTTARTSAKAATSPTATVPPIPLPLEDLGRTPERLQ